MQDKTLQMRIDEKLFTVLKTYCQQNEIAMAVIVRRALREFLERQGLWPPKED